MAKNVYDSPPPPDSAYDYARRRGVSPWAPNITPTDEYHGVTIREAFAMHMMGAIISPRATEFDVSAKMAVKAADALLLALERG